MADNATGSREVGAYGPEALLDDVEGRLRSHGLHPARVDAPATDRARWLAAGQLLRGFGIAFPGVEDIAWPAREDTTWPAEEYQPFDPDVFLDEVEGLLRARGLSPIRDAVVDEPLLCWTSTGLVLRSLGVFPARETVAHYQHKGEYAGALSDRATQSL